jgi:DNA-binding MarR family transcriptional regulator
MTEIRCGCAYFTCKKCEPSTLAIENVLKLKLSATQLKIILLIFNCTSPTVPMSIAFISEKTQISPRQVQRELKRLIEQKIVKVDVMENGIRPRFLSINMEATNDQR